MKVFVSSRLNASIRKLRPLLVRLKNLEPVCNSRRPLENVLGLWVQGEFWLTSTTLILNLYLSNIFEGSTKMIRQSQFTVTLLGSVNCPGPTRFRQTHIVSVLVSLLELNNYFLDTNV